MTTVPEIFDLRSEFTHMLGIPHPPVHNGMWNDPDVNHIWPSSPGLDSAALALVQGSILFHDEAQPPPPAEDPDDGTDDGAGGEVEPPPDPTPIPEGEIVITGTFRGTVQRA